MYKFTYALSGVKKKLKVVLYFYITYIMVINISENVIQNRIEQKTAVHTNRCVESNLRRVQTVTAVTLKDI